jgi:hypothetical protein
VARYDVGEALERVFPIRFLGTEALGEDDDLAATRGATANEPLKARADRGR